MHAIRTALLPLQFCADCITATRGYDCREGQPILIDSFASRFCVMQVDTLVAAVGDAQITYQSGLRKVTWNLPLELGEIPRDRRDVEASED